MNSLKKVNFPHPYYNELYVYSIHQDDDPKDAHKLVKRMMKINPMSEDATWESLKILSESTMMVSSIEESPYIIWGVNESVLSYYNHYEVMGLIAHEANHVVQYISAYAYGDEDTFDEETYSYLLQRIVEHISPIIMKWHAQYNGK